MLLINVVRMVATMLAIGLTLLELDTHQVQQVKSPVPLVAARDVFSKIRHWYRKIAVCNQEAVVVTHISS